MAKACEIIGVEIRKHEMTAVLGCGSTTSIPEQQLQEIIRQVYRGRKPTIACDSCEDE